MVSRGERQDQQKRLRSQLVERFCEDQLARVQKGHVAGHALDLADLMAGKNHRPARAGKVDHALEKLPANHGVQPGSRLVEDQERGVRRQGQRQGNLGLHSLGQGLDLAFERKAEAVGELGIPRLIGRRASARIGVEPGGEPADLGDAHPVVQGRRLGHVADAATDLQALPRGIEPEHLRLPPSGDRRPSKI